MRTIRFKMFALVLAGIAAGAAVPAPSHARDYSQIGAAEHHRIRPRPRHPACHTTNIRVTAKIKDGVATTRLEQTITNPTRSIAEADWVLPLPTGASADQFTMTVGGKPVAGEVVDANNARRIYENIVRQRRDPGLLEYYGAGCLRARIFPVPAQGKVDVVVQFRQIVPATANLHEWSFPLRAITGVHCAQLTLDLQIDSRRAIKNVYSPLAGVDVVRNGDHSARASLELPANSIPQRDLTVFYGTSEKSFGLDLLTFKRDNHGYFLAMLAPKHDWPTAKNTTRIVQFVIDTSGSMKGQKIDQAKKALRFFVQSLSAADRFNIIPFSTEARPFFEAPVECSDETIADAVRRIGEIEAAGGTNIEDALVTAMSADTPKLDTKRTIVPITVFLTDGQPTIGTTDPARLAAQIKQANSDAERVFVFGVGNNVNTRLLDRIALDSRGDRDYVREHEDIEVKTSALFTKLSNPVMTDLDLTVDGIETSHRSPSHLPDLFKGSRLLVLGRYSGKGQHAIRLKGTVDGVRQELVFEGSFDGNDKSHDFVPALWAERRIAILLEAIRLNGNKQELTDEVKRLGREFGLVTPYTSHLIVEEGDRLAIARGFRRNRRGDAEDFLGVRGGGARIVEELKRAGAGGDLDKGLLTKKIGSVRAERESAKRELGQLGESLATGQAAVDRSLRLNRMSKKIKTRAVSKSVAQLSAAHLMSRTIGSRTFHLAKGVWIDQAYKASMKGKEHRIKAFSDDYFELLRANPAIADCLAFSSSLVIVLPDGRVVEILDVTTE